MRKVLIMCDIDPNTSPRPNRMIRWLKDKYQVTVLARQVARIDGLSASLVFHPTGLFGTLGKGNGLIGKLREFICRLWMFMGKDFEGMIWASLGRPRQLRDLLAAENFDLVITHDCTLLPLAFAVKGNKAAKVMLDAREYYPRNFDDQFLWRMFVKPVNKYLCERYLPLCDKVITVGEGLAREYNKVYHIAPEVVMSLPQPYDLRPSPVRPDTIRLIHHGNAAKSRKLELMIEMMDFLDERFSLDLMLMGRGKYLDTLHSMAGRRRNVRIIPPVPMGDIVPTINQYDIGVYLLPPTNFNTEYMLPNKFFEFIQARLALAISPSTEMKILLEKYDCGVVASDFTPRSLARLLNGLSAENIASFKERSHKAALELNAEVNRERVLQMVRKLVGNA